MLRMISPKAVIVANLAHWLIVALGMVFVMVLGYAGLTIAADGASDSRAILDQMKSSGVILYFTAFTSIIVASLAGYVAARMAPAAKLLNGALSVSGWLIFDIYVGLRGSGGESHAHIPFLLDFLTSYGVVIPALAGAYLGSLQATANSMRDQVGMATVTEIRQSSEAAPVVEPAPARPRRLGFGGTGLGIFVAILGQLLLTKHEQNVVFVVLLVVIASMVAAAFVIKRLKNPR